MLGDLFLNEAFGNRGESSRYTQTLYVLSVAVL
jgi:hypothetical protein